MGVTRLTSLKGPSGLAVVGATGAAVCVCLFLVISDCSGVQASSPSLNGGAAEGRPFFPRDDDVAEHAKQRGSLGGAEVEEEERAMVNHSGRSTAHRRSSSPSSSLAAGSSLLPKSVGSIFLATSAVVAAMSLFGLGKEGRRGGASGRGVEEEGNVEELLRTAGATSGVGTAAGLSKPLLSKNVLLSLTALGLLFIASSLATAPFSSRRTSWKEVKVTTPYDCTASKCTLKFYNGGDGVRPVYRVRDQGGSGVRDLELVLPPEYELYLGEPEMKRFIKELFTEFFGQGKARTEGSGEEVLPVPLPWGVRPEAFFKGRATTWGNYGVSLHYECKKYPIWGCTMWYPNSAGKNAAVKRIIVNETPGNSDRQVVFTAMLPPAFGAKTKEYLYLNVITALDNQAKLILHAWQKGTQQDFKGKMRVRFPLPPNLTAEIFDEQPAIPPAPLTDSQDSMEIFAVVSD